MRLRGAYLGLFALLLFGASSYLFAHLNSTLEAEVKALRASNSKLVSENERLRGDLSDRLKEGCKFDSKEDAIQFCKGVVSDPKSPPVEYSVRLRETTKQRAAAKQQQQQHSQEEASPADKQWMQHLTLATSSPAVATTCSRSRYRTFEFFFRAVAAQSSTDITVVTQLTVDRLDRLETMAQVWAGPVSAAILIQDINNDLEKLVTLRQGSAVLMQHVDIHLLFSQPGGYPVNTLRNLALTSSRTDTVFLLDVDLIPNPNSRQVLETLVQSGVLQRSQGPVALVVPAFETVNHTGSAPGSKMELIQLIEAGHAMPVHLDKYAPAHQATNYSRWYNTSEDMTYVITYELFYEPYYVLQRPFPLYDERFIGYGHDKCAHAYELSASGFQFVVAPTVFLVHLEHESAKWRSEQDLKGVWHNWWLFCEAMQHEYGFAIPIPRGFTRWRESTSEWLQFTNFDGRRYYYNQKTEISSWKKPADLAVNQHTRKQQQQQFKDLMWPVWSSVGPDIYHTTFSPTQLLTGGEATGLASDGGSLVKQQCVEVPVSQENTQPLGKFCTYKLTVASPHDLQDSPPHDAQGPVKKSLLLQTKRKDAISQDIN